MNNQRCKEMPKSKLCISHEKLVVESMHSRKRDLHINDSYGALTNNTK